MSQKSHINVTIDLSRVMDKGENAYDLRIPIQLTVKQLIKNVMEALKLQENTIYSTIKVVNKNLLLADDDFLANYPVTDGDIFAILPHK